MSFLCVPRERWVPSSDAGDVLYTCWQTAVSMSQYYGRVSCQAPGSISVCVPFYVDACVRVVLPASYKQCELCE